MEGTAAVYVRVSSLAQVEGRSLEGQVADCRRAALGKGLTVPDGLVYVEEGVSGTQASRPQFDLMLEAARAGQFQTLVVWKLSRFARNARAALNSLHELHELEISVVFLQDGLDTSSQIVRAVVLPVLAGFAEMESNSISAQSMLGKVTGSRAGAWVSGVGPFGFRTVGEAHARRLEPDIEPWDGAGGRSAADVVQLAFGLCVDGGLGPFQVAQRLNALEIPPPAAWPRHQKRTTHRSGWEHVVVKKLLTDETYAGRAAFGRTTHAKPSPELVEARRRGGHARPDAKVKVLAPPDRVIRIDVPRLVDEDLFQAAQRRLSSPDPRRKSHAKRLYLLTGGRTVCGRCGRNYTGVRKGANYSYMVCAGMAPHLPAAERCGGPRFRAQEMEDRVWRRVLDLLNGADGQLFALVSQRQPAGPTADQDTAGAVSAAEARLAELDSELRELARAMRRGALPSDVADEQIREVDAERGVVRQQLRRLQAASSGVDAWTDFTRFLREAIGTREALHAATPEQRDRWLRDLAVRVTVQEDGDLAIDMVLPMGQSEVEAQREAEWAERMADLPAMEPPR